MKLSKKIKKILLSIFILSTMITTMSGCVNNKSWDDLTLEEQEEVRQTYKEEKQELEEELSEDTLENHFAKYILDKVEQGIEYQD